MANETSYTFEFLSGGTMTVNIESDWVEKLKLFDAEELKNERKHTRSEHRVYLDKYARAYNDDESDGSERLSSNEPNPLEMMCRADNYVELLKKLDKLTPRQLEVLALRLNNLHISNVEIAKRLGTDESTVREIIESMRKRILKQSMVEYAEKRIATKE